jgi:hypothetical protein
VWDTKDELLIPHFIDQQIEACFLLCETFVTMLADQQLTPDEINMLEMTETSSTVDLKPDEVIYDPHCLGIKCVSETMVNFKNLIIASLRTALKLAVLASDPYGARNAVVYFWNYHLHIFRKSLHKNALTEVEEFVNVAREALDSMAELKSDSLNLDDIRLNMVEASMDFLSSRGDNTKATELGMKYMNSIQNVSQACRWKRIVEKICRLQMSSLLNVSTATTKGAQKQAIKLPEMPKFGQSIMTMLGLITFAETDTEVISKEQIFSWVDKAMELMTTLQGSSFASENISSYEDIIEIQTGDFIC